MDGITLTSYDKAGNVKSVTDARAGGNAKSTKFTTQFSYDPVNRQIQKIDAEGGITVYDYNEMGKVTLIVDPRAKGAKGTGYDTVMTYDLSSRLKQTTDALGQVTKYTYDWVGNLIRKSGPQSASYDTTYTYDALNRQKTVTLAANSKQAATYATEYNALGLVSATIDPLLHRTETQYDSLKHVQSVTEAVGTKQARTTGYKADLVGNVDLIQDPRGSFYDTTQEFDKVNRLTKVTRNTGTKGSPGPNYEVQYGYDKAGNLVTQTDPRDPTLVTKCDYDALNRQVQITDAANGITVLKYDVVGNLTALIDPRGGGSASNTTFR